jgi:hypothetical protein
LRENTIPFFAQREQFSQSAPREPAIDENEPGKCKKARELVPGLEVHLLDCQVS